MIKITDLAGICYVRQKEQKWRGMQSSVKKHVVNESFAVLLEDSISKGSIPCTKQLIDVHENRVHLQYPGGNSKKDMGSLKEWKLKKTLIKSKNALKNHWFIRLHQTWQL